MAVALAEKAFAKGIGARVSLASNGLPTEFVLFGEDASRILLSCDPEKLTEVQKVAKKHGVSADVLGTTISERLEISLDGRVAVSAAVTDLNDVYESALESALQTDPEMVAAEW